MTPASDISPDCMTPPADALAASELIGFASDPIALFGPDGALRAVNRPFRSIFRQVDGLLKVGTPWTIFLDEAARHGVLDEDTRRGLALIEDRLIGKPGAGYDVLGAIPGAGVHRFWLGPTSDGGMVLVLGPEDDPIQRLSSERELEQLMAKVLEACPTCLTMARIGDGHILYRSPAATELLGKGLDSREHFARREERADFITALLPNSRVEDMRITAQRPDGTPFPASISARLIDYRGEEVIVSSIDDLSESLAIQDELARQKDQIFQSEKMSALGELLAGVAHELNNPLSIVVGNAQILFEETTDEGPRRRIEKLSEAAERCVRIVRTFLSLARERPLDIAPVPAESLVEKAADAYRAGQNADAIELAVDVPPGLPPLLVDEVQIVQVLSNIMINAHHAVAQTGRAGRLAITAGPAATSDRLRIRLTDNGPGIGDDIAGRIFDPLFTTKEVGKGTGIGLALCHRIVTAHGGAIWLDRDVTDGAAFVVELPAATS